MSSLHNMPASTANALVEGYCQDFVELAASLAQTLEQVSMRGLSIDGSRASLERVERGMRDLADAISGMLVATPRIATPAPTPAGPRTAPRVNAPVSRGPAPTAAGRTPTHLGEAGASDTTIGNCIIQGDTSSMPLTSVFQFLTRVHKTGTLTIEFKGEHLVIEVAEGCVEFTTSDQPPEDETICQVLLELGHAHQKQVEALAGRVDDGWGNGLPAGLADDLPADDADDAADDDTTQAAEHKVLVELMRSGMVSDAQIQAVLQQIAKRRLRRIIRCKGATYAFHEGIRETARNRIRIRMPIRFSAGDQKSATPTRSQ